MRAAQSQSDPLTFFWQVVAFTRCTDTRKDNSTNPQAYVTCPQCHQEGKFAFSPKGAHCFRGSCGYSASLWGFANQIGFYQRGGEYISPAIPSRRDRPLANWQRDPQAVLDQYISAPDVYERWQKYKPVNLDTIIKYQLGVGVLPASRCKHKRLIVPLIEGGKIVGFRGRAIDCACTADCPDGCKVHCPKWLTCGSAKTILFGLDGVSRGDIVYWLENMVDAMLVVQTSTHNYKAVASTAGAGTWKDFIQPMVEKTPALVVVALDNDLAGQPTPAARRYLIQQHIAKHGAPPIEGLNGIKITNAFLRERTPVHLLRWPDDAPPKADGFFLLRSIDNL